MDTTVYNYDATTGEYLGAEEAAIDPLEPDRLLVPAWATEIPPPAAGERQVAAFRDGAWELVADYRGYVYWTAPGERHEIRELGVSPPEGALTEEPPLPEAERRATAKAAIDRAAGRARLRFVSPGELVDQEYREAEAQALDFQRAGFAGTVPAMVQVWADASGMTAQAAAENILLTAQQMRQVLEAVLAIRLQGKAAVDAAADDRIEAVAQGFVDQLDALKP